MLGTRLAGFYEYADLWLDRRQNLHVISCACTWYVTIDGRSIVYTTHCKKRLVVFTGEWLPWLHGLLEYYRPTA